MAKLRDEITSLQDDVSKSTDQVQQKKALLFFCRQSVILSCNVYIIFPCVWDAR